MDQARIVRYKLDPEKVYTITKLHTDGMHELKGIGAPMWEIQIGHTMAIAGWYTTVVLEITKIGKGLMVETQNSTYLIEEFQIDKSESKNQI